MAFEPHLGGYVVELLARDIIQRFALLFQLLLDLYRFFGHHIVSFFRAPYKSKTRSRGDAFMTVRVKTHSEEECLGLFLFFAR